MIKTRFAPSPTGFLHVGGLRTALYAYLFAKQNGGVFMLRIEDTDRDRFVADGMTNILKSLYWAGLIPDEGVVLDKNNQVSQIGDKGPYIQSERLEIYHKYVNELLEKGHAYHCFCSADRLKELRSYQEKNKLPTGYDGHCCSLSAEEVKKHLDAGEKYVVRMKMPKEGETTFYDLVRGEVTFKNELIDDQVILKSDGYPTYHLAVVVDDHLMEVTHVIRGDEWLSSTPKHLQLYKFFGWEAPQTAHLSLLLNPDKTKLSKRQGDVAVDDYRMKGYLPQAIINFVAMLGWNPGDNSEMFTLEELSKVFNIEKIIKSGAVFNLAKLDWYNKEYIKKLDNAGLVKAADHWIKDELGLDLEDEEMLEKAVGLEKERITTLAELPDAIKFVFEEPMYDATLLVWKKSTAEEAKKVLVGLKDLLNNFGIQDWNRDNIAKKVGEWIEQNKYSNGIVLWPLRTALSGQENSPGPYEIADVLGMEKTLERINLAISKL